MPDRGSADRPGSVLLIEDDVDVRRFLHERLTAQGFLVSEAPNGEHGLELFDGQRFDVVLLDVRLPGIDGFSVLRSIRRTSEVPVLLLTAASDEADRVLGLENGADDYVTKPFLPARTRRPHSCTPAAGTTGRAHHTDDLRAPRDRPERARGVGRR